MEKKIQYSKTITALFIIMSLLFVETSLAQRVASVSGNWNDTATWGGNPVPTSTQTVTINGGVNVAVNINTAVCSSLTVNIANNNATGTLTFNNSAILTVSGNIAFGGTGNRRAALVMTNGGTLKIGGAVTVGNFTFTKGTGTIEYNGSSQIAFTEAYNNLALSGSGTKTLPATLTVTNNLSISGAVASLNAGTTYTVASLTVGGSGTNTGTWGSTSSTATYKNNTYFAATTGRVDVTAYTSLTPTVNSPIAGTYNYNGLSQGPNTTTNTGTGTSYTFSYVGVGGTTYGPTSVLPINAGSYAVTATVLDSADGFYRFASSNPSAFTIGTVPLTVTANNNTKIYGDTQSTPQVGSTAFSSIGLQNGESIGTVTLTYDSGALAGTSAVGSTSSITPSAATGGTFTLSNYNITYAPNSGILTVTPAPLTITANNLNKVYGTTQSTPEAGSTAFESAGLQNGESIGTVTLTYGSGALAAIDSVGSTSTITPSVAIGGTFSESNYDITYVSNSGILTVTAAPLTVTADNASKCFGTTYTFGTTAFTSVGLQNSEIIGSVTLTSLGANSGANIGSYVIVPSAANGGTFTPSNYAITYSSDGLLTVNPSFTPTVSLVSDDADNTFCEGTDVTFTATADNLNGGTVVYDFKVDGNSVQNSISNTYNTTNLTNGQTLTIDITVSGGACLTTNTAGSNSISNTVNPNITWYLDADGDTYGDPSAPSISNCNPQAGYVLNSLDCDDNNFAVHPGVAEVCFNGIDDDCDGLFSEDCPAILTSLPTYNCGITLDKINSTITAKLPTNAGNYLIGYMFRITNLSTNVTVDLPRSIRNFQLTMTNIATYNTSYLVSVAAVVNGEVQAFSTPCAISTPSIPTTDIARCGAAMVGLTSNIVCYNVTSAVAYQFEISLASNPSVSTETIRSSNAFTMVSLNGLIPIYYNTYYTVRVKVKVLIDGVEVWGDYGNSCTVKTPQAPEIFIIGCVDPSINPTSMTTNLFTNVVAGTTMYRFTLINSTLEYEEFIEKSVRYFNLAEFNALSPLVAGEVYSVFVEAMIYGVYNTGKDCNVKVPGSSKMGTIAVGFEAKAYPNPFANNFLVDVTTESKSAVSLKVYDMIGRLVDEQAVQVTDLKTLPIGDQYPSGVYNVVITQGDEIKTLRVVKR